MECKQWSCLLVFNSCMAMMMCITVSCFAWCTLHYDVRIQGTNRFAIHVTSRLVQESGIGTSPDPPLPCETKVYVLDSTTKTGSDRGRGLRVASSTVWGLPPGSRKILWTSGPLRLFIMQFEKYFKHTGFLFLYHSIHSYPMCMRKGVK